MEMMALVWGYLWGTCLTAYVVAQLVAHEKPTAVGSGNPGSANIGAVYGKLAGTGVACGDLAKTFIALVAGEIWWGQASQILAIIGLGVFLGHCFPIWFRFQGGKGVAVLVGFLVYVLHLVALVPLIGALVVVIITQSLTLGALTMPLMAWGDSSIQSP